jgi:hypothetical protein
MCALKPENCCSLVMVKARTALHPRLLSCNQGHVLNCRLLCFAIGTAEGNDGYLSASLQMGCLCQTPLIVSITDQLLQAKVLWSTHS